MGSFQVMVPWPQDLQGNLRKYHCMNRDHRFDSYLFFIWLVEIHWLLDAQITFWDCRVHFHPFFFQQPFLKPVVYKQVCRAHQTLVINQKGQNELSISKIQLDWLATGRNNGMFSSRVLGAYKHKPWGHSHYQLLQRCYLICGALFSYMRGMTLFIFHNLPKSSIKWCI